MLETDTRKRPSQDPIAPPPTKKRALTSENGSPILVNGNTPSTPPAGDEPGEQDSLEVCATSLVLKYLYVSKLKFVVVSNFAKRLSGDA